MGLFDFDKKHTVRESGAFGTVFGGSDNRDTANDAARSISGISPDRVDVVNRRGHVVESYWGGAVCPAILRPR